MSEQSNFVYIVLNTRQIQNNNDDLDVFVMSKVTYISQIIKVFKIKYNNRFLDVRNHKNKPNSERLSEF